MCKRSAPIKVPKSSDAVSIAGVIESLGFWIAPIRRQANANSDNGIRTTKSVFSAEKNIKSGSVSRLNL